MKEMKSIGNQWLCFVDRFNWSIQFTCRKAPLADRLARRKVDQALFPTSIAGPLSAQIHILILSVSCPILLSPSRTNCNIMKETLWKSSNKLIDSNHSTIIISWGHTLMQRLQPSNLSSRLDWNAFKHTIDFIQICYLIFKKRILVLLSSIYLGYFAQVVLTQPG